MDRFCELVSRRRTVRKLEEPKILRKASGQILDRINDYYVGGVAFGALLLNIFVSVLPLTVFSCSSSSVV